MEKSLTAVAQNLLGIGLYTPTEAGRLIDVSPLRLVRWLRGHDKDGEWYEPLWRSEVDIGDDRVYLSFRDLMEARIAALFIIKYRLSAQKVRRAIQLAREIVGDHPLSTTWLKTDGRTVFLRMATEGDGEPRVLDLFKSQHAFSAIIEQSLRDVEFDGAHPRLWWPRGRKQGIVVDPERAFGRPIEEETSVPAEILAKAAKSEGSLKAAAQTWQVPVRAIRRAVEFQQQMERKPAA